jgi:hypothetical protein
MRARRNRQVRPNRAPAYEHRASFVRGRTSAIHGASLECSCGEPSALRGCRPRMVAGGAGGLVVLLVAVALLPSGGGSSAREAGNQEGVLSDDDRADRLWGGGRDIPHAVPPGLELAPPVSFDDTGSLKCLYVKEATVALSRLGGPDAK